MDAKVCEVYEAMDAKENESTGHWPLENAIRRTNHPVGEDQLYKLATVLGPEVGINIQDREQLRAAIPLLKMQNTWQRYDWMGKQIQARPGALDIREAVDILANGPVFNHVTLHSFVFDPTNHAAYIANAGNNPPVTATLRAFARIDLKEWLGP